jgi:hypothetical protein
MKIIDFYLIVSFEVLKRWRECVGIGPTADWIRACRWV